MAGGAKRRLFISRLLWTRFTRPITNNLLLVASLLPFFVPRPHPLLAPRPLPLLLPPSLIRRVITIHNVILLLSSLYMFLLLLPTLPTPSTLTCYPPQPPTGPLWYVPYLYYISKYYELLDTFLQFLLSRPPRNFPLHVYHHTSAIIMAWSWMEYNVTLSHVGLGFNCLVHVVMYGYYCVKNLTPGNSLWIKPYVTTLQVRGGGGEERSNDRRQRVRGVQRPAK